MANEMIINKRNKKRGGKKNGKEKVEENVERIKRGHGHRHGKIVKKKNIV